MTIFTFKTKYKGKEYMFDVDRNPDGEISLVSPLTGELIKVNGTPLREKYEVTARKHLKEMEDIK